MSKDYRNGMWLGWCIGTAMLLPVVTALAVTR